MTRASSTAADRIYSILEGAGKPLNTREIHERLNNYESHWKSGRVSKTQVGYTMIQVSQVLSKSRWFKKVGEETNYSVYGHKNGTIPTYVVADYPSIIEVMLTKTHRVLNPKRFPKFVKDEWVKQGGVI